MKRDVYCTTASPRIRTSHICSALLLFRKFFIYSDDSRHDLHARQMNLLMVLVMANERPAVCRLFCRVYTYTFF